MTGPVPPHIFWIVASHPRGGGFPSLERATGVKEDHRYYSTPTEAAAVANDLNNKYSVPGLFAAWKCESKVVEELKESL
jgi:hypothetical protein